MSILTLRIHCLNFDRMMTSQRFSTEQQIEREVDERKESVRIDRRLQVLIRKVLLGCDLLAYKSKETLDVLANLMLVQHLNLFARRQ